MRKLRFIPSIFLGKLLSRLYIIVALLVVIFPLLWIFSVSFRDTFEITQSRFLLIPKNIVTGNYKAAIDFTEGAGIPIGMLFKNSAIATISSLIIIIIISTIAGYAFAKLKFKGSRQLFLLTLLGMMLPIQILMIPLFLLTKHSGLLNTYFGIILPYVALGLPFSIFILRGFFLGINDEIIESAKIDGASQVGIFIKIILPLARPAIAAVVIFMFIHNWNEFLLALVLIQNRTLYTLPVGISKIIGQYATPWGIYSAMVFMAALPTLIIFLIFQNWFIKGLTAGSIKG